MRLRTMLFGPGSRPDLLAKLPRSHPDAVVIDLEDSVPADARPAARVNALAAANSLVAAGGLAVFVRVNSTATDDFALDLDALSPVLAGVLLPKAEHTADVMRACGQIRERVPAAFIIAGIETAAGVLRVEELLAADELGAAYFGAEDYVADLGGVRTEGGLEVLYARSRVALAARCSGIPAIDQVVVSFDDEERFVRDARVGRSLGYSGKLCIHPAQVPWARDVFCPTDAEVDRAERLIAAYERAVAQGHGASMFDGQMVDAPVVDRARRIVDAAQR